jgi:hypothetical protein
VDIALDLVDGTTRETKAIRLSTDDAYKLLDMLKSTLKDGYLESLRAHLLNGADRGDVQVLPQPLMEVGPPPPTIEAVLSAMPPGSRITLERDPA